MGKRERVRRRAAARKATRKEARKGERTALARASEKTSLRFDGGPETVLVLGDGDLSFSGGLTAHLAAAGASVVLTATRAASGFSGDVIHSASPRRSRRALA